MLERRASTLPGFWVPFPPRHKACTHNVPCLMHDGTASACRTRTTSPPGATPATFQNGAGRVSNDAHVAPPRTITNRRAADGRRDTAQPAGPHVIVSCRAPIGRRVAALPWLPRCHLTNDGPGVWSYTDSSRDYSHNALLPSRPPPSIY